MSAIVLSAKVHPYPVSDSDSAMTTSSAGPVCENKNSQRAGFDSNGNIIPVSYPAPSKPAPSMTAPSDVVMDTSSATGTGTPKKKESCCCATVKVICCCCDSLCNSKSRGMSLGDMLILNHWIKGDDSIISCGCKAIGGCLGCFCGTLADGCEAVGDFLSCCT